MFGALMIVDMLIFGFMAYNYTYVDPNAVTDADADDKDAGVHKSDVKNKDIELIERNVPDVVDDDQKRK